MNGRLPRKAALFLLFLWATGSLTFFMMRALPGDPALAILGARPRGEDVRRLRRTLRLDRSLAAQYLHFIGRLAVMDLGESLVDRRPVRAAILAYLPNTLLLAAAAMTVTLLLTSLLGVYAAFRNSRLLDWLAAAFTAAGLAIPVFLLGLLLIMVFALGLKLLPVSGSGGAQCLVLPALTLGIPFAAHLTRMSRAALRAEMDRPYVLLARAKGLGDAQVFGRHVLKNALVPVLTLAGLQAGALLGGAVVVESVFSWPGVGTLLVHAVRQRDFPMVQGTVMLMASIYLLLNFLVDIAYRRLDPRIRHDPTG